MFLYQYELGKACDILVKELFKLKPGETFVITADTESDPRVVDAAASAAFTISAKPMVIWLPSPLIEGKLADSILPLNSLTGALMGADAWLEINNKQIFDSTPSQIALKENKKLRYLGLTGATVSMVVRCIGRVNYPVLKEFIHYVANATKAARHVRMTTPVTIKMVKGIIVNIEGKAEANSWRNWLSSLDDPIIYHLSHFNIGLNPKAKLSGNETEDEVIVGAISFGFGHQPEALKGNITTGKFHTEVILASPTIYIDDIVVSKNNKLNEEIGFIKMV
ncbi:unnamed protein product [marine sediment metagenome]|uniref:Leucyl aminopeptidase n=1 Tax=marine sediment metagenome TaxID=412755 RepID=X1FFD7_9ZZZZ